jgi:hypothetical protein
MSEFICNRIEKTEILIAAYEDALLALATAGVESYTLDTGQSVQKVTKYDISSMNKTLDSLYNRLVTLQARCSGGGVVIARSCR